MEAKNINQLVTENLSYVKSLANRFKGKGVDFDDLVSEGYMAMTQAAQKYDTERGTQFIAYAAPFIRKAMEQARKMTNRNGMRMGWMARMAPPATRTPLPPLKPKVHPARHTDQQGCTFRGREHLLPPHFRRPQGSHRNTR